MDGQPDGPINVRGITRRALLQSSLGLLVIPALASCGGTRAAATDAGTSRPAGEPARQEPTAPALAPMRINWSAIAAVMAGIWMANDTGAWRECGIEPELSNVNSSSKVLPALIANDFDGTSLDVMAGVRAIADGGDVVFVAGITNRQIFSVFTRPEIRQPADLAGRTWGITRVGASTDVAAHLALEQWGLSDDDITFVQLGNAPTVFAALQSGQIDAATLGPPNTFKAQAAGFTELINLAEDGPAFPSVALATRRSLAADQSALIRAYVKGYALGVQRFREDKDTALAVYRKYLQSDDTPMLEAAYEVFKRYLAWPPVIAADGLDRMRHAVAVREEPRAADLTNDQVFDRQFMDQLQAEGLFG